MLSLAYRGEAVGRHQFGVVPSDIWAAMEPVTSMPAITLPGPTSAWGASPGPGARTEDIALIRVTTSSQVDCAARGHGSSILCGDVQVRKRRSRPLSSWRQRDYWLAVGQSGTIE